MQSLVIHHFLEHFFVQQHRTTQRACFAPPPPTQLITFRTAFHFIPHSFHRLLMSREVEELQRCTRERPLDCSVPLNISWGAQIPELDAADGGPAAAVRSSRCPLPPPPPPQPAVRLPKNDATAAHGRLYSTHSLLQRGQ